MSFSICYRSQHRHYWYHRPAWPCQASGETQRPTGHRAAAGAASAIATPTLQLGASTNETG